MKEKSFEQIGDTLNVETKLVSVEKDIQKDTEIPDDPKKDYEYTRANLYQLIEKGQEAINGILEIAQSSDHPRAYEVAGQLIKSVGDVSDKLLDLQKKMKDLDATQKNGPATVNNSLFVGSTSELSKLIKQGLLNNIEEE